MWAYFEQCSYSSTQSALHSFSLFRPKQKSITVLKIEVVAAWGTRAGMVMPAAAQAAAFAGFAQAAID
jgi:hypothetical protein